MLQVYGSNHSWKQAVLSHEGWTRSCGAQSRGQLWGPEGVEGGPTEEGTSELDRDRLHRDILHTKAKRGMTRCGIVYKHQGLCVCAVQGEETGRTGFQEALWESWAGSRP